MFAGCYLRFSGVKLFEFVEFRSPGDWVNSFKFFMVSRLERSRGVRLLGRISGLLWIRLVKIDLKSWF